VQDSDAPSDSPLSYLPRNRRTSGNLKLMPRPFHPDRDVEAQNAFKKRVFLMLSGKLGGSLRPEVVVYGSCSPTKRGSAGSTVLDHAGRQRG
jgi:hypothetical protein